MNGGETIEVIAGDTERRLLVFRTGDGSPLSGYSSANVLIPSLWAGEDATAIVPGLEVEWYDGTQFEGEDLHPPVDPYEGAILTIPGGSTLDLVPGAYEAIVEVTSGSESAAAWKGRVEVLGRPGSASGPYTLTTYRAMRTLYPPVESMQDDEADLAGFARQRAWATAEFLRWIGERYNPTPGFTRRRLAEFDPVHGWEVPTDDPPPKISLVRQRLAAGGLVLPPPDDSVVETIVARLAIYYVLARQGAAYAGDAQEMRLRALIEMDGYRAYVDLDDDGEADAIVHKDCTYLEAP